MVNENSTSGGKESLLRVQDVAQMLHVSPNTLRRWADDGKLKSIRINHRGDRRFRPQDVEIFLEAANNQWKKS